MSNLDLLHFHGAGGEKLGEPLPLAILARPFLNSLLGRELGLGHVVALALPRQAATGPDARAAELDNLTPELSYLFLLATDENGKTIYRHAHPTSEVLEEGLRQFAPIVADLGTCVGFSIWPGGNEPVLVQRPSVSEADEPRSARTGKFLRRLTDAALPRRARADYVLSPEVDEPDEPATSSVHVLIHRRAHDELTRTMVFSNEVESGGFLLGFVFDDTEREGHQLVELVAAVRARHYGASLMHFTFTGDSFSDVQELIAKVPNTRLLGWYHTHLFPASARLGLSSVDVRMHFTTFSFPWQIAGLVNIDIESRVLRFYARHAAERTMARCPVEVIDGK
jgi:hypothetical protein